MRLKTLKVKSCRGILNEVELPFGRDGMILAGDNGAGKTSFVDALERLLTGRCSSLDTGDRGLSWDKQGQHIKSNAAPEITLVLTDGSKDVPVTLTSSVKALPAAASRLLAAAQQQSFILRRRHLLDFIFSKPNERYKAIAAFLQLSRYGAFEDALKQRANRADTLLNEASTKRQDSEDRLRSVLKMPPGAGLTASACVDAANVLLHSAGVSALASLGQVVAKLDALESALAPYSKMDDRVKAQTVLEQLQRLGPQTAIADSVTALLAARRQTGTEEHRLKGAIFTDVLEKGLKWIKQERLTRCPLCNSAIDAIEVDAFVTRRLKTSEELLKLQTAERTAKEHLTALLGTSCQRLSDIEAAWKNVTDGESPEELTALVASLSAQASRLQATCTPEDLDTIGTAISDCRIDHVKSELETALQAKLATFPDHLRYEQLTAARQALQCVRTHWATMQTADRSVQWFKSASEALNRLVKHAENGRKEAVQAMLNRIGTLAAGYYSRIHPLERTGSPELTVPARGSGSIDLKSDFYGEIADPRGRYSEGHLDSLGLCIFLAICKLHYKLNPELALLVLDDVMHSVDGDHRLATARLILSEFSDHQIVITTHDPLWFENLKAESQGRDFVQRRIATWEIDSGPVWGDHLSDYEWLISKEAAKAKPADRVIKAGRLLEEMLQNLCEGMKVKVPYSIKGGHSLSDLWTGFLDKAKKNDVFRSSAGACVERIETLRGLRNLIGAHYNEWAQPLTGPEAETFCGAVVELRQHTYCPKCKMFIKRIGDLDGVWSCSGQHLWYGPRGANGMSEGKGQVDGSASVCVEAKVP